MGLNRITKPPTNKEIRQFFQTDTISVQVPEEFSDENISGFFRGLQVSTAPESTAISGISQDVQLTPVVGKKMREITATETLAPLLGVASGALPFIDEIPGLREKFEEAREIAPSAFKAGEVGGMLALGGGSLAGAKLLLKPLVKKVFFP